MARATTIWYVENTDGDVVRACTVRHELDTWLTRRYAPAGLRNAANCPVTIYRIPDNGDGPRITLDPNTLKAAL